MNNRGSCVLIVFCTSYTSCSVSIYQVLIITFRSPPTFPDRYTQSARVGLLVFLDLFGMFFRCSDGQGGGGKIKTLRISLWASESKAGRQAVIVKIGFSEATIGRIG